MIKQILSEYVDIGVHIPHAIVDEAVKDRVHGVYYTEYLSVLGVSVDGVGSAYTGYDVVPIRSKPKNGDALGRVSGCIPNPSIPLLSERLHRKTLPVNTSLTGSSVSKTGWVLIPMGFPTA
jgi:hypothetical protein